MMSAVGSCGSETPFSSRVTLADQRLLNWYSPCMISRCAEVTSVANARVLIIETVVPPTPGPHLSKELDIAMMVLPRGKERTQEEYADLAARSCLRLQRIVETKSPYSILEMVAA